MLSVLLFVLLATAGDCENERALKGKNISEKDLDDFETCSKRKTFWMDFPAGVMQKTVDSVFSPRNKSAEPRFLCFSRRNTLEPECVTNSNFSSWDENNFDPTIKTVIIIHGFKDGDAPWTKKLKDALISREGCNVYIVEYGHQSDTYSDAFKNIPEVGKQVAVFIRNLMESRGLDPRDVHIIGHSAGAQVAGYAGQEVRKAEKGSIGRITGLDPAGPNFYAREADQRLDATDAAFVDVIHTNRGCNRLEGFGYSNAIGHFDFYPNGGHIQPGCLMMSQFLGKMTIPLAKSTFKYLFGTLEQRELQAMNRMLCSHIRSYELFTASILNEDCKLHAVQCSSWRRYASGQCDGNEKVAAGYYADGHVAGSGTSKKFYLETTADPPYCR